MLLSGKLKHVEPKSVDSWLFRLERGLSAAAVCSVVGRG